MAVSDEYVRICPVCGAERAATDSQCGCGTLLIGVDLSRRAAAGLAETPAAAPAPPAAGVACPHADCGAANPAGGEDCLYCGRPLSGGPPAPSSGNGLYNLPAALSVNFTIERVLPAGGAEAELMLLKGRKTGVRVMAKLYRPGIAPKGEVLERVAKVAHAHVVRLLGHGISDGVAYEVMEYCSGGSLRELMGRGGSKPVDAREVVAEIAEALAALHECRVVHRDLKPENVLVRRATPLDLVLTDFGIASLQDATQLFTGLARTARYAAPEALTGVLDESADFWSLGMIVLELLSGEHPFAGLSDPVVAHRLATANIDTGAIGDPAWRKLCRGLLQRDPALRWGIAEIRRWLANDPGLAEPPDSAPPLAHPYRLGGEECRSLAELAAACSRHWPAASKDLARGLFESWADRELRDHDLLRFLHDLKERGGSPDLRLFRFIRHLAPAIPPVWRGESLAVGSLLAMAARAVGEDTAAGDWLDSLFAERVLEYLAADAYPDQAALQTAWRQAWGEFGAAWRRADQALGAWRNDLVARGEALPDIDALMFGSGGGLFRPEAGRVHGALLLAGQRDDYARQLRATVLAEAAGHLDHSPWLADLCRQAAGEDLAGMASCVALLHLLPEARQASEAGQQRVAAGRQRQAGELVRLGQRVNEALAGLRAATDELQLLFGEESRYRLTERLNAFADLAVEARGLAGGEAGTPALRVLARAEPLIGRMRDRLDEWHGIERLNQAWRNRHVMNALAGALLLLFMFAPAWLPWALAAPIAFGAWRLWMVARQRSAIRRLAAALPLRVAGAAQP